MTGQVVLDAGVLLAAVLEEATSERARELLTGWRDQAVSLAAPGLLRYEVAAVLRKAVTQKRLTANEGFTTLATIGNLPIRFYLDTELIQRAFEFIIRFDQLTANAAQYLAVADQLGCDLWTADERLFKAVSAELDWVKWLGNLTDAKHAKKSKA